jgi:DNA-binding Lrp family transcriptional regulator
MLSKSLYKRTLTQNEQVPETKRAGGRRFGMLPADVAERRDLTFADKVVLSVMGMDSMGSGVCAASHQVLADLCGGSRMVVLKSQRRLMKAGLIEEYGAKVGQVQSYALKHERLVTAGREMPEEGKVEPKTKREWVTCPLCRRRRPTLLNVGWCRSCAGEKKTEKIARRIVKEELRGGEPCN